MYSIFPNSVLVHNQCGPQPKKIPNPFGKKGGAAHRAKVGSVQAKHGGTLVEEYAYDTPGGYKGTRYADVVELDANGNVREIYQVGRVNKNGTPVMRESLAIEDIMNSPQYNGAPIHFIPL